MNLSNAVYNFAKSLVESAASGDALENAKIHSDLREEITGSGQTKYIRVDDLIGSIPQPGAQPGTLKEFNAVLIVQFIQIPATQALADRIAARNVVDRMALDFAMAIYNDQKVGTNDCNTIESCSIQKANDQCKAANVKCPISILRLTMNKK